MDLEMLAVAETRLDILNAEMDSQAEKGSFQQAARYQTLIEYKRPYFNAMSFLLRKGKRDHTSTTLLHRICELYRLMQTADLLPAR